MSASNIDAKNDQKSINFEASSLPEAFYRKFQVGENNIEPCEMSDACRQAFQKAISQRILMNNENEFLKFWAGFTSSTRKVPNLKHGAVYLEISQKQQYYPELFEKLIIAENGEIIKNMNCELKQFSAYDDSNIKEELRTNSKLIKYFKARKVGFFIYHKSCNALVSIRNAADMAKEHAFSGTQNSAPPKIQIKQHKATPAESHQSNGNLKTYATVACLGGVVGCLLGSCLKPYVIAACLMGTYHYVVRPCVKWIKDVKVRIRTQSSNKSYFYT
ncbi:MAG: hypothetical protein LBB11_01325 [Puniceicoccales bacterium]|nr:hypothetical protein [Puniceicoccales bacterium]